MGSLKYYFQVTVAHLKCMRSEGRRERERERERERGGGRVHNKFKHVYSRITIPYGDQLIVSTCDSST